MGSVKGQGTIQSIGSTQKGTLNVTDPLPSSFSPVLTNPIAYSCTSGQNPVDDQCWNITINGAGTSSDPYVSVLDEPCS